MLHTKFGVDWPSGFGDVGKLWKSDNDRPIPEHRYTISLRSEPAAHAGELKSECSNNHITHISSGNLHFEQTSH